MARGTGFLFVGNLESFVTLKEEISKEFIISEGSQSCEEGLNAKEPEENRRESPLCVAGPYPQCDS